MYKPKPRVASKVYRSAQAGGYKDSGHHVRRGDPLNMLYNMVTFPVRAVVGGRR